MTREEMIDHLRLNFSTETLRKTTLLDGTVIVEDVYQSLLVDGELGRQYLDGYNIRFPEK